MSRAELFELARNLSREEQLQLAHDLYLEADGPYEDDDAVDAAWAGEISQRLERIVDGTEAGVSHDDVMKHFGL